jgi:hypothetical protein
MDEPNLPRHVLERAERRWASILSHQAAKRPATKAPGMQQPSPESTRQPSESKPAQSTSKRQDWNRAF